MEIASLISMRFLRGLTFQDGRSPKRARTGREVRPRGKNIAVSTTLLCPSGKLWMPVDFPGAFLCSRYNGDLLPRKDRAFAQIT